MTLNEKITISMFIVIVLLSLYVLFNFLFIKKPPQQEDIKYLKQIDSLELVIKDYQLKNDNLLQKINKSKDSIIYIDKMYEKDIEYINNNSVDENIMFFTDYLSKNYNK